MQNDFLNSLHFHSNGKLMITGEYLVIKGAKSLAIPLKFGQDLWVGKVEEKKILWKTFVKGEEWFSASYSFNDFEILSTNQIDVAKTIQFLLRSARSLNSTFLSENFGYNIVSFIEFDIRWGFGSSSSLVSNVAEWAGCDPFLLNRMVFGGSGYDIACAKSKSPVIYQLLDGKPIIETKQFYPSFSKNLYLVWLNRKQDTRESIQLFKEIEGLDSEIEIVNEITEDICNTNSFDEFEKLLAKHESIISSVINIATVQEQLFSDFQGTVKSLGAWGGDFVLVASQLPENMIFEYFRNKGYQTIFKYDELI